MLITLDPCAAICSACEEVHEFLSEVPGANEESITDFLAWRLKKVHRTFRCAHVVQSTRAREHRVTGADFEMDLWMIGRSRSLSLAVQAKKLPGDFGGYARMLRYGEPPRQQMRTLMAYAKRENKVPAYMFYSGGHGVPSEDMLGSVAVPTGVFLQSAKVSELMSLGLFGKNLSRSTLLSNSSSFHRLFCHGTDASGFESTFEAIFGLPVGERSISSSEVPRYVVRLLDGRSLGASRSAEIASSEFPEGGVPRVLAVIDLRETSWMQ